MKIPLGEIHGDVEGFSGGFEPSGFYVITDKSWLSLTEDDEGMDKFMEIARKMENMAEEEKKRIMMKNRVMCICRKCPTYSRCMGETPELLFCFRGKSACPVEMKACICPTCPVTAEMGLGHAYYCVKGSESEIRGL